MLLTRRTLLAFGLATLVLARLSSLRAEEPGAADAFVEKFGTKLVGVVNSNQPLAEKQQQLRPLIDGAVDVDTIARFCLGRFATTATPEQVKEFTSLFHAVLVNNISSKIGDYRGVTFTMRDSSVRGDEVYVGTVVQRPNSAPTNVRWVISTSSGAPKIVDVVAEGTSLRLTQRSDYASYLTHNGNDVEKLIAAMRRQVESS